VHPAPFLIKQFIRRWLAPQRPCYPGPGKSVSAQLRLAADLKPMQGDLRASWSKRAIALRRARFQTNSPPALLSCIMSLFGLPNEGALSAMTSMVRRSPLQRADCSSGILRPWQKAGDDRAQPSNDVERDEARPRLSNRPGPSRCQPARAKRCKIFGPVRLGRRRSARQIGAMDIRNLALISTFDRLEDT
jgi:hypothetical protein